MNTLSGPDIPPGDHLVCHRIKECCVHLHSNVQKWKELNSKGFDVANRIVNSTIQQKYTQDTIHCGTLDALVPTISRRLESKMILDREHLFLQLKEIQNQMLQVMERIGSLVGNLKSAVEIVLSKGQNPDQPLFSTLPPSMFGVYSEELYHAYSQEMSMRESIVDDLLSQTDRDTLTVYLSCWMHEPLITSHINEHLEAMLFECGLRS